MKKGDVLSGRDKTNVLDECQRIKNGPVTAVSAAQQRACGHWRLTRLSEQLEIAGAVQIRRGRRSRRRVSVYIVIFDNNDRFL